MEKVRISFAVAYLVVCVCVSLLVWCVCVAQVGLCACVCVKCTVQWTDCNVLCIMQWTACLGPWGMGFIILCHGLMVEDVMYCVRLSWWRLL